MVCFDVTFTAILLKQISVKSSMSLAFSAPMKTHLSVHYSPSVYNNGAKGELQMERDHKWQVEGIAAAGQTSQGNSHAKC